MENIQDDPLWTQAIIHQESGGDPNAVSPKGAVGTMQTLPTTLMQPGFGVEPAKNNTAEEKERVGRDYSKAMNQRYGDKNLALIAYNYGPGNTDKWIQSGADVAHLPTETKDYVKKVNQHYEKLKAQPVQMAQNVEDPIEKAFLDMDSAEKNLPVASGGTTPAVDPIEKAFMDADTEEEKNPKKVAKPPISVPEDLAKTTASLPAKIIGALPQIPAMAGNAVANAMGYSAGKLMGASPEQQQKLNSINPFFTGNTPADAVLQAGKAIVTGNPGEQNPLTGSVLHEPETMPGRFENALGQAAVLGPAAGVKMLPSLAGGLAAQTTSEALPDNPLAPLLAGIAGGGATTAGKSIKFRATPEELAHNALLKIAAQDGGDAGALSPGNLNSNEIIPGSKPTLAQVTGNPNIASQERQIENTPAAQAQEKSNEAARQQHFEKVSGTPQDVEAMKASREAEREANTDKIFQPGQVADPTPVVTKIDEILNGAGGERSAVKETLNKIRQMIVKKDGETPELQTDPEKLYRSVKGEIEDLLDKKNLSNAAGRQSSRELLQVKQVLDDVIEKATPGYKKYLDDYHNASGKIDAAEWLQGLKLTDATGRYTLAKVKTALDNAKKLQKTPGINDAKHITPDQMQGLQDLHDDLLRRESTARSGMGRGSPTKNNFMAEADMNSALGRANQLVGGNMPELAGSAVGSGVGSLVGAPGIGAFAGDLSARYLKSLGTKRTAAAKENLQNYMLNPEEYKQYLLNKSSDTYAHRLMGNLLKNP